MFYLTINHKFILLKRENYFILFAKRINLLKGFGTEYAPQPSIILFFTTIESFGTNVWWLLFHWLEYYENFLFV